MVYMVKLSLSLNVLVYSKTYSTITPAMVTDISLSSCQSICNRGGVGLLNKNSCLAAALGLT